MKLLRITLWAAVMPLLAFGQNVNVQKAASTNAITGNLNFPDARTLSFGTTTPATMTGPAGALTIRTTTTNSFALGTNSTNAITIDSTQRSVFTLTNTATSGGIAGAVAITPTYNQASGTAANTDLLINRTETAIGSGTQLLIDAQRGGASLFSVNRLGGITASGSSSFGGVTTAATILGTNINDGSNVHTLFTLANVAAGSSGTYISAFPAQTDAGSAGSKVLFSLTPTYNQTGSTAATDFKINRTQTAVGSGAQLFVDFQVAGTSQFKVDNVGGTTIASLAGTGSRAVLADTNGLLSAPVSDELWKEPLRALPESYGIEMVMKLRPAIFKYKDQVRFGANDYIGFGARATAAVLPEVTGLDRNGTFYLTDEKLTAVLVKAVQQQQGIIAKIAVASAGDSHWWSIVIAAVALLLAIRANLTKKPSP